ncbi:MAG: NUDIX hydrolase [Deltaproteobacteria bacterium]|nr:NUDIX hydrolase [Deltaproteobacteria bacterium]MBW2611118.1 NUDIX hydrolase [Deltaproteobacteria bacterium]MBW2677819.1 NUDIX hydrolase [Deltaproteobacteria bacterium]
MSSNDASGFLSRIDSKREVYRGRQFSFFVEQVTHPNGVQSEMGVVRHPGSTVIVPVFDDGAIGLIRQYRHAVSEYVYETPAGTMEPDEEPLVCAYRELEEETGFAAGKMIFLGKTYLLPAYSDEVTHVYLARDLRETTQDLDPDEIIEVHRLAMDKVLEMISSGEIIDALSILSIYHAVRYLG